MLCEIEETTLHPIKEWGSEIGYGEVKQFSTVIQGEEFARATKFEEYAILSVVALKINPTIDK